MFKIIQWTMVGLTAVMMSACSGGGSDCPGGDKVSHLGIDYCEVTSPYTGEVWLDRNLGASQVCTAFNDEECYGDYYQWGRNADGHEKSDSPVTNVQASNVDNVGDGNFIESNSTYLYDWAQVADGDGNQRAANWSKTDGSFVCPVGYRVPTLAELKAELLDPGSAEIQNREDAFNSFLKLPSAGYHRLFNGALAGQGSWSYVWASSVDGSESYRVKFDKNTVNFYSDARADGYSVRCLRD